METISLDHHQGVAVVTLNRPEARNAMNVQMAVELGDTLNRLRTDESVHSVVLSGAGGTFCSGGDMRESASRPPRSHERRRADMDVYARIVREGLAIDKPVVAAVDGSAFGAGLSIALLADIVLVSTRVRLSCTFQRMGLAPDTGALYTLPRVVGLQRAKELVFSAREFGATEAVAMGMALEELPHEELMPRAMAIATSFSGASATALSVSKRALQASLGSDLNTVLELEASGQAVASGAEYLLDAARRFVNRQPLRFQWPARVSTRSKDI